MGTAQKNWNRFSALLDMDSELKDPRGTRVDLRRSGFTRQMPVQESERVQLGRGFEEYRSRRIWGRDLVLLAYEVLPRIAIHTVPNPDWVFCIFPLNDRSELRFNGRVVRSREWFVETGPDGYATVGENRHNIAIAIRRIRLHNACAAVMGVGAEDVALGDLTLRPDAGLGDRLHRALIDVALHSVDAVNARGDYTISETLENDLISTIAGQIAASLRAPCSSRDRQANALQVVRAATTQATLQSASSLEDLCHAAGVSQRWLHRCFMRVLGISPYHYLRLARLTRARDLLLAADASQTLVKQVALTVGYRMSGRFAAEYRALHGERPSDTLNRNRRT